MADPSKVKREPVDDDMREAHKGGAASSSSGGGPTILPAEAFTHGGIRKAKFEPKVPARRQKKPVVSKREPGEDDEVQLPSEIMKLVKQSQDDANQARGGKRPDTKAPVRVAFGFGSAMGGRAATGFSRGAVGGAGGSGVGKKPSIKTLQGSLLDGMCLDDKSEKTKKSAVEPWDYSKYYPVALPLRKPNAGSPDELDKDEFGEAAATRIFNEDAVPAAEELDLMVGKEEERLFFFQIPYSLPLEKGVATTSDQAPETSSSIVRTEASSLKNMPGGQMGKLLVYKSGAVKLKLGDIIFEAVPGSQCLFAQELAAINPVTKHCCFLGDVSQRVVLVPDVDNLLNSTNEIG